MTIQIKGFVLAAMWFALGLISYLLIGEYSVFLWADPWIYIYMAFWPVIWIWIAFIWVMIIVSVIGIIMLSIHLWENR